MCSIHWGYLVITVAYLAFMGFWVIGKKHRDFDLVSGFAGCLNFLIGFIMAFFAKCPLCWGFIAIDLFILCAFTLYFIIRQIKTNKEIALRAREAMLRKREAAAKRVERKKARQAAAEVVATSNERDNLKEQSVTTKANIYQYLAKTYGNKVVLNGRSELAKNSDDYFANADAHHAVVSGRRICFAFVYENDMTGMAILLRTNEETRKELAEKHSGVEDYAKKTNWTKIVVDDSYTEEEIFSLLSTSYDLAIEEDIPAVNVTFEKVESVSSADVGQLISDQDALALVEKSARVADKTQKGTVGVETLNEYFSKGDIVTLDALKRRVPGFDKNMTYCKVLAGNILEKNLTVDLDDYSLDAIKMILVTGGRVLSTRV